MPSAGLTAPSARGNGVPNSLGTPTNIRISDLSSVKAELDAAKKRLGPLVELGTTANDVDSVDTGNTRAFGPPDRPA